MCQGRRGAGGGRQRAARRDGAGKPPSSSVPKLCQVRRRRLGCRVWLSRTTPAHSVTHSRVCPPGALGVGLWACVGREAWVCVNNESSFLLSNRRQRRKNIHLSSRSQNPSLPRISWYFLHFSQSSPISLAGFHFPNTLPPASAATQDGDTATHLARYTTLPYTTLHYPTQSWGSCTRLLG